MNKVQLGIHDMSSGMRRSSSCFMSNFFSVSLLVNNQTFDIFSRTSSTTLSRHEIFSGASAPLTQIRTANCLLSRSRVTSFPVPSGTRSGTTAVPPRRNEGVERILTVARCMFWVGRKSEKRCGQRAESLPSNIPTHSDKTCSFSCTSRISSLLGAIIRCAISPRRCVITSCSSEGFSDAAHLLTYPKTLYRDRPTYSRMFGGR